jgi:uncharacterized membrane protein YvbJ
MTNYVMGGYSVSESIKRMLVEQSKINNIILNRSSYIDAIETIHALKEEDIMTYTIDNDLKNGNVLFFVDDELVGECY